ncbi:hypothetical protein [Anaeromicropila populeti]|uniref:Uncharacterized protein n=1 Tax=Anaeromicropila populeti TaxID=37658 RepID=A0A1I6LDH3_9FIRM|nr:hypothetical protein [Anaeromicropila populeti]SFS01535.1 hypothetical protein SAMN05661086_03239 [Anaeromicropila populeti]
MEQAKELIGVLYSISIVAHKLAEKLAKIEKEISAYERQQSEGTR